MLKTYLEDYSGVSIVDFEQENTGWMGPFSKFPKFRIPEKSGKVTCLTIQKAFTNTFSKGDHWIVPELKQLVTQTNHNKNLIFLMADIALRYTVKTSFANLHK